MTVGGSCWESPESTARRARSSAIHVAGSVAWPASSTTARSNAPSLSSSFSPVPVSVASTTSASARTRLCMSRSILCSTRPSLRSAALRRWRRCGAEHRPSSRFMSARSRWICAIWGATAFDTCICSVCSSASLLTRWGLPTRTTRSPAAARRSTRLSTAALEGAAASTRCPPSAARVIRLTSTPVLPVPGGPWITARGLASSSAKSTTACWHSSNLQSSSRGPTPRGVSPSGGGSEGSRWLLI
mmetsp:Transcript_39227/g.85319  ORF Transcript_39227/g.85319 Transcript_39227/m.85319 type:complete len:244 (-) Transcript_39227:156-887(-)